MLEADLQWSYRQLWFGLLAVKVIGPGVEHGAGDHGESEKRPATADTLHSGEGTPHWAHKHGAPQVVVCQLLFGVGEEQAFQTFQVFYTAGLEG